VPVMENFSWRPIHRLTADWNALGSSPSSRDAISKLAAVEPAIRALGVQDLGELVTLLAPTGGQPVPGRRRVGSEEGAGVLRAMLRSEDVHPLVGRAILQALVPGLVGVARRLSWGNGGEWVDGGTFFVDTLTTAWEVIADWSGEDRPYAVLDLLSAVRCRLRRQLLRHRARLESPAIEVGQETGPGHRSVRSSRTDIDELARAIDAEWARGVEAKDAAVLYAQSVLGYSLTELSELTGHSRRYLSERRARAASALIA
jgi:hypothetical protein